MSSVTIEIPENVAVLMKGLPTEKIALEAIVLDLYRRAAISSARQHNFSAWAVSNSYSPPGGWASHPLI